MCASFVYKRRKLRNSVALLPKQNIIESSKFHDHCDSDFHYCHKHHLLSMVKDDANQSQRTPNASIDGPGYNEIPSYNGNPPVPLLPELHNRTSFLNSRINGIRTLTSATVPEVTNEIPDIQNSTKNPHSLTSDHISLANESCSSSKSNLEEIPALTKVGEEDAWECSSSGAKDIDQLADFSSSKEFCISVLKTSGLVGGAWSIDSGVSLEVLGGDTAEFFSTCKICGIMGNPQKMLICDLCEEAFHLPCCQVRDTPREEWYCQPCFQKKPRPLLDAANGKLFPTISEEYKRRILLQELGPIHFSLIDTQPHTSRVRIGKDFQVEVPEWSGPISDDPDCFGEPLELNPNDYGSMNDWKSVKSSKRCSIGNWIQCRDVIYNDQDSSHEGVLCGKWRRAPLFVTQTDDWDCSCSVVWDPFHADCAVPQELETDEVLKHLKYVDLLRTRLKKR